MRVYFAVFRLRFRYFQLYFLYKERFVNRRMLRISTRDNDVKYEKYLSWVIESDYHTCIVFSS